MTVRRATSADIGHCVEMARRFIAAADKPEPDQGQLVNVIGALIDGGGVFVSERGAIAGVLAPLFYKPSHLEAHEMAWWCEDGQGMRLLRAFEKWAGENGAQEIVMSTLPDFTAGAVGEYLKRRGYRLAEAGFRKRVV